MALKIKKKVSKDNPSKENNNLLNISDIGAGTFRQKGFSSYKKNINNLLKQGYSIKDLKSHLKKLYFDNLLPRELLFSQLKDNSFDKIKQSSLLLDNLNEVLFSFLFEDLNDNKINKELISDTLSLFSDLIHTHKDTLSQIKLYSSKKDKNGNFITLFDRLKKELSIFYSNIKKYGTSLDNLYSIFKMISFISSDILDKKNIFLLGSFNKITSINENKQTFFETSSIMNYGHGLEIFSILNYSILNNIPLSKFKQFEITTWNNHYKYFIEEALKANIISEEQKHNAIASVDLLIEDKHNIDLIEVKHYSENEDGRLNIYLKRPSKLLQNMENIQEFSSISSSLTHKKSSAFYFFSFYEHNGNIKHIKISFKDYSRFFEQIGELLKNSLKSFDNSSKIEEDLMINDVLFSIKLNFNNKKINTDNIDFENDNIFKSSSAFKNISSFSLNFDSSEDFYNLLINSFNGKILSVKEENNISISQDKLKAFSI